jgi:SagB-type dehydrogenase family enzyme
MARSPARALALALTVAGAVPAGATEEKLKALPAPRLDGPVSVEQALARRRSLRSYAAAQLSLADAAQLLWAAQGVTGAGGLRTAPSAGALYPLELYLAAGAVAELSPGLYHYEPQQHRLALVHAGDLRRALAQAALGQDWLADAPAVLVLAAVPERTARKYGARAARYVPMEAGHAAENVYLQAVALGLGSVVVGAFDDARLARAAHLPAGVEPLALLPVGRPE